MLYLQLFLQPSGEHIYLKRHINSVGVVALNTWYPKFRGWKVISWADINLNKIIKINVCYPQTLADGSIFPLAFSGDLQSQSGVHQVKHIICWTEVSCQTQPVGHCLAIKRLLCGIACMFRMNVLPDFLIIMGLFIHRVMTP